uniref:Uncharacterized protein MANES_06G099800 n=1 Tax=Rhizophora mucronata TaxID=61149 RepID=A0A2P2IPW7_RHIMU
MIKIQYFLFPFIFLLFLMRKEKKKEKEKMEEEKAAAYYDELTRRGEGAARFKQGLGFSGGSDSAPSRGSALPSASSFLSNFVKASSPTQASKFEKQAQLQAIQNKLKKKPRDEPSPRVSQRSSRESSHRRRSRSRERERERHSRGRSRSRSRDRDTDGDRHGHRHRDRDRDRERRRRRSRSASPRRHRRSERRSRSRGRSSSPRERRRLAKSRSNAVEKDKAEKERNCSVDYSQMIQGYEKMTQAERVKAAMKLQLDQTAEKDAAKGMGSGWERFEFNKDAPLDDEQTEVAEDDAALVKHIGQSFRFSTVEARREEQIKAAHDEAIFGTSGVPVSITPVSDLEVDDSKKDSNEGDLATSLLSEKVLSKQQGSWRDRARRVQ